ncbi:MAG TPA: glycosyltransferase family 4 protein [Solirubrobacteraceae bacterium]|nr:glycosyltransferase family 4 protein [Solirubrobacteraceae bacterium]
MHNLPTGGAMRVLSEWLAHTSAQQLTIYTRDTRVHQFAPVPERAQVIERPLHTGTGALDEIRRLALSPREGARLAAEVDKGGHDAVFCFASVLTQALDVLPFLRTPSVFYAPEPLRSAYEPPELVQLAPGWRGAVTRMGINPIEIRRRQLDRRYIRAAHSIVTHSRFTSEALAQIYGVQSEVVHLGVDAEAFTPPREAREGYVLSVGALHPLKGHDQVIEAIATIPTGRPRLVVIGDRGEAEGQLSALAQARGVQLELRRGLPFAKVVELYQRAGAVVCAQIREPFGLVPLEAMACATPVVAVEDGGFRETVRNGETGLLVKRDSTKLGAAITSVLSDNALATRLGEAGRKEVQSNWTWDKTTAEFDRLLIELRERDSTTPKARQALPLSAL